MENLIFYFTHGVSLLCVATIIYTIFAPDDGDSDLTQPKKTAAYNFRNLVKPLLSNVARIEAARSAVVRLFSRRQVTKSNFIVSRENLSTKPVEEKLVTDLDNIVGRPAA